MWDERYQQPDYVYGREPNAFLRERVSRIPGGRVLSLADGEGRNGVFLASSGFAVTTVDSSTVGVEKAVRLAEERGVSVDIRVGDLAHFDLGNDAWDGIVSIFCHVPPPVRSALHRQVVAGLKPGGVLVLEAYTAAQLGRGTGGPPVAELMMSASMLAQELDGLVFEHLEELEREVVEGAGHTGVGAVVQCVAVKPPVR